MQVTHYGKLELKLNKKPARLDLSPSRWGTLLLFTGIFILFCAVSLFSLGAQQFYEMAPPWLDLPIRFYETALEYPSLWLIPILFIPLLIWIGSRLFRKEFFEFDPTGVHYKYQSLFEKEDWFERRENYKGILMHTFILKVAKDRTTHRNIYNHYQIIELVHQEPDKASIPLFVHSVDATITDTPPYAPHLPRKQWRAYADYLRLPLLEEQDGELVKISDEKPLTLQEQFKQELQENPDNQITPVKLNTLLENIPEDIQLVEEKPIRLTLTSQSSLHKWAIYFFLFFPIILIFTAFNFWENSMLSAICMGILGGFGVLFLLSMLFKKPYEIIFSNETITFIRPRESFLHRIHEVQLPKTEIEKIRLFKNSGALSVETENERAHVGQMFSRRQLQWLHTAILASTLEGMH